MCKSRSGSVVSASDMGPEGREFKPWPVHPFSQCLSSPRCSNGNQQITWGQPDKMLRGSLRWTSIPFRGSRNTPSRFILQKPEIRAGIDELSGSPNYDWGRLYLYLKRMAFVKDNLITSSVCTSRKPRFLCLRFPYTL